MTYQIDAVGVLYSEHHSWLVSFLYRRLGNRDNAADLAHDAFERLLRSDPAQALPQPRAYLTTIAKNLVVSHFRHAQVERAYLDVLASQPEATAPSLEARALILETLERLCRLVETMTPRTRTVFLLAQLDGLSYPQVAHQLGLSIDVVKKAMSKALQQCYAVVYE
ncbi:sigma-70 family RNA polymerase sigma factor [Caballeronia sp. LZ035]|uniref:sigma-70 family RNA polymerase sigma factor n=1 Tax=Caballeronia sp. LZ035 TaxID=3038568 RepID=UPI002857556C|nr:sigma-70 family RNA polymerase sigma factor [Caballeronia sp. LZ035]MDR5759408.1 sigma-70 family RNA polymerase sigma factor [Caballeronia sp. LZ035]